MERHVLDHHGERRGGDNIGKPAALRNGYVEVHGVGCEDSLGELANFLAPNRIASGRLKDQVDQIGVDAHGFSLFRAPLVA